MNQPKIRRASGELYRSRPTGTLLALREVTNKEMRTTYDE